MRIEIRSIDIPEGMYGPGGVMWHYLVTDNGRTMQGNAKTYVQCLAMLNETDIVKRHIQPN